MVVLISTPGAANANSYVNEALATTYLTELRLHTAAWSAASVADREKALMWATAQLDRGIEWYGSIASTTQSLRLPRTGLQDADYRWISSNIIPTIVQHATAELANLNLAKDRSLEPVLLGKGFSDVSVGPVSVTVDPKQVLSMIPQHILMMLVPFGEPKAGSGGGGTRWVRVIRT